MIVLLYYLLYMGNNKPARVINQRYPVCYPAQPPPLVNHSGETPGQPPAGLTPRPLNGLMVVRAVIRLVA